jgi:hypothetical protein
MLAENRRTVLLAAVAVVLAIALIVGGQYLAVGSAPPVQQLSQSAVIGQAGFAYLGGLRMMGAGLLMSRIDPQFHQYGQTGRFEDRVDLLPTIRLIQLLNPQLEEPYYSVSYVLFLRGKKADALNLAKEGIKNNPTSGLLRANYAEILFAENRHKNLGLMLEQARVGLSQTATYNSPDDKFESYAIFRTVYILAGDKAMAAKVDAEQKRLASLRPPGDQSSGNGLLGFLQAWSNSATSKEE